MRKIFTIAILSRLGILLLAIITNHTLEKYDTSNESTVLQSFANWDGVHFQDIATQAQYRYEKAHAFFPFLPWLVRIVADTAIRLVFDCSLKTAINVTAYGISNVSFVIAACLLNRLGREVFLQEREAYLAALLFCLNPASIFMSAFYTESIFAALSFGGMILSYRNRKYAASLIFCFAAATRSNGAILSVLFIGLPSVWMVYSRSTNLTSLRRNIWAYFVPSILPTLIPFIPFVLFQAYASHLYCSSEAQVRPWCDVSTYSTPLRFVSNLFLYRVPIGMYSWIQSEYWGNGLFSYWCLKQIPNFLLASPMIFISVDGVTKLYVTDNHYSRSKDERHALYLFCFRFHWVLLFVIAFLTMNIQVTTRFLSACPSLYWYVFVVVIRLSLCYTLTQQQQQQQQQINFQVLGKPVFEIYTINTLLYCWLLSVLYVPRYCHVYKFLSMDLID
jgi:GPI mannosyltransferase 2